MTERGLGSGQPSTLHDERKLDFRRDEPIGHTIKVRARPRRWWPFKTTSLYDKTCRCVEAEWMADQLRAMAVESGQPASDVQILCVRGHRGV